MELDQTKNDASNLKQSTVTGTSTALQFKISYSANEKVNSVVLESLQPLKHQTVTQRSNVFLYDFVKMGGH